MKLLTVGLVLVTAAVAGCSSTTAGSAGAIQDDVELAGSAPASSSAGPTSSPDPVSPSPAPTEAAASPVASPTDSPSPSGSSADPALLGGSQSGPGSNDVCDTGLEYVCGGVGASGVGTVFYASATPFECGENMASVCNYLEVAPNGWNGDLVDCPGGPCGGSPNATSDWGQSGIGTGRGYAYCSQSNPVPNASGGGIGSGFTNTSAMLLVDQCTYSGTAAGQVRGYDGGGMTDWSLPSVEELNALYYYSGRNTIGGFAPAVYWSSSYVSQKCGTCTAFTQHFASGVQSGYPETSGFGIRPIRAF